MFCRGCGEEIPVDSLFCSHCGKKLVADRPALGISPEPAASQADTYGPPRSERIRQWARSYRNRIADVMPTGDTWRSMASRLTVSNVFFGMGILFATVGFVLGLVGNATSLGWLLYGIALVLGSIYTRGGKPPKSIRRR